MKQVYPLLIIALALQASQVQAQTPTRLKRVMVERYNPQISNYEKQDSVEYYYAPGYGGEISVEEVTGVDNPFHRFEPATFLPGMLYDSALAYKRQMNNSGQAFQKNIQAINNMAVDKFTRYNFNMTNWIKGDTVSNTYSNNMLTKQVYNGDILEYIYNSGKLDTLKVSNVGGGSATISYSYYNYSISDINYLYTYGSYTQQIKDHYVYSSSTTLPDQVVHTFYNQGTSQWDTVNVRTYMYNNNNLITQEQLMEYNQYGHTGVVTAYKVDIQYDNQNHRVEDVIWEDFYKHGPAYAGLEKHMRKQYTYNQYDKLATYNIDHWDSASSSWQPLLDTAMGYASKTKFEYEVYWPASIEKTKGNTTDIKLFPCPASDFIRIETKFDKANSFTASIIDMQGRTLRQWTEVNIQQYTRTVPLTALPAGNYVLKLSGDGVNSTTRFVVAR